MSSVIDSATYEEDAEVVWLAAIYYLAVMGYTLYERVDALRQLVARTPAASLKLSAGQVIKITVLPLGSRRAKLVIGVTSFNEQREQWFASRLLRVPREQLIYEVKAGISRLLPVMAPANPTLA